MSKIDLNRVWDDARDMGRANKDLLVAIAGAFVLLPGIIADQLISTPETLAEGTPAVEVMDQMVAQFADNWPVLVAHGLITAFGSLAMLTLLLRAERPTVAESLKAALVLLPGYYIATLLQGAAVGVGFFFLVIPGLYLIARFALVAPVVAAERIANPLTILRRSAELTRGNGWRILAMLAVVFATAMIIYMVMVVLARIAAALLLSGDLETLALSLVTGFLEAGFSALVVLISAALYRAVAGDNAKIAEIFH